MRTLRSIGVRYVAAGEDFSVFLTVDGRVFTCGAGKYTGQNSQNNELLPRMVVELMGTICKKYNSTITFNRNIAIMEFKIDFYFSFEFAGTQISCGSRHTLTYVPSRGIIYAFGLNSSGQLGIKTNTNAIVPQIVFGPWVN